MNLCPGETITFFTVSYHNRKYLQSLQETPEEHFMRQKLSYDIFPFDNRYLKNHRKFWKQPKEGEGEVAFFSAKRWDRRNRAGLIESATPCHDAQVVGPYRDSNQLRLTVLAAMSDDYTTAPQHLQEPKSKTERIIAQLKHLP